MKFPLLLILLVISAGVLTQSEENTEGLGISKPTVKQIEDHVIVEWNTTGNKELSNHYQVDIIEIGKRVGIPTHHIHITKDKAKWPTKHASNVSNDFLGLKPATKYRVQVTAFGLGRGSDVIAESEVVYFVSNSPGRLNSGEEHFPSKCWCENHVASFIGGCNSTDTPTAANWTTLSYTLDIGVAVEIPTWHYCSCLHIKNQDTCYAAGWRSDPYRLVNSTMSRQDWDAILTNHREYKTLYCGNGYLRGCASNVDVETE